ncbi:MAG: hypothetical protein AB8F78_07070 [Saprospiraceae bacterium]
MKLLSSFQVLSIQLLLLVTLVIPACSPDDDGGSGIATGPVLIDDDIDEDRTLTNQFEDPLAVDYLVTDSDWKIFAGLNIDPGVRIAFTADSRMFIENGGYVVADGGPAADQIHFQGEVERSGHWRGIGVLSADTRNSLSYVTVRHTGSSDNWVSNQRAAIGLYELSTRGQLSLSHVVISDGEGFGLYIPGGGIYRAGTLRSVEALEVYNMSQSAVHITIQAADLLPAGILLAGNGFDGVEISNSRIEASEEISLGSIGNGQSFLLPKGLVISGELLLRPDTRFLMGAGTSIEVRTGATMQVLGSETGPVSIAGEAPNAGHWQGIAYFSSDSRNLIRHARISNGGSSAIYGTLHAANIGVVSNSNSPASLTLEDVEITSSAGCGVSTGTRELGQGAITLTRVVFTGITGDNECNPI